jgi:hypothetical protein
MLVLASPLLFFAWIGSGNKAPARSTSPQALAETCVVEPRPVQGEYLATDFSPRVAPFGIETAPNSDYLVKLEDARDSSNRIWFFVHGGESFATHVPLGTYVLKYAVGKRWCGIKELFGKKTMTKKGRTVLIFERQYDGYSGNAITLIAQRGGNFHTEYIPPSEF